MAHYIDKDALVAEIEKRLNYRIESLKAINNGTFWKEEQSEDEFNKSLTKCTFNAVKNELFELKCFLDILEVKEVDDELQGIEKEVAEGFVERINKKRIPISLKGEKKAKFKNEFNTLWQTIGGIQFANVAKHIIERLCLHFAAWGAYNLKEIGQIDKDDKKKMDVEVKEADLEKEINEHWDEWAKEDGFHSIDFAKHFYELGLSVSNKAQKGE